MDEPREPGRPDPDALLERVAAAESRANRGRLKVFFGASPGVGKTYAMLTAARRLAADGIDVVTGVIETHGRSETAALAAGLESLPRKRVEHKGRTIDEFDLDAALARRPSVVLVDELAHTNAPGSRHPKRWQDVEELLGAGIDVYTTVNVQHLERLNDVVGAITGIAVRETVPDRVFDNADEVVLVDLPPDDLLARLKQGKVYLPEQAERAAANFFRKGNLLALRELALRRTADRVDDEMRTYRRERVGGGVWKARDALLVAIGPSEGSDKVVRAAARLAAETDAPWHAVYVETPALQRLPDSRRRAILEVLKLAQDLGAQTSTVPGTDPIPALVEYARTHNLGRIMLGRAAGAPSWRARLGREPAARLGDLAPDIDAIVVSRSPGGETRPRASDAAGPLPWRGYAAALALSAVTAAAALLVYDYLYLANTVMLFLLAVVITASALGRGPAVLSAIVNVLAFDYLFVPPRFSFAFSDARYLFTFAVMLVVGLVVAQLTASLRYQARVAGSREKRARSLFEMARELSGALTVEQVAETGARYVATIARAKVALLLLRDDDTLEAAELADPAPAFDGAIARWALDRVEAAGAGTNTLPSAGALYLPLKAPMRARGVIVVEPQTPRTLMIPEQRRLLETCAALIAIALERVHFVSVAQQTTVEVETERLRNSLLSTLSHDLRTPLTALVGLSESLSRDLARDGRDGPSATALVVRDQARRTAQLVNNLLEMARLEAGRVPLRKDWQSLQELAGSAIRSLEPALGGRPIEVDIGDAVPLVSCDPVMIERVLVNLLENANKYSPEGTPVRIAAARAGDRIEVTVEDRGPGLPAGREATLFDKFIRGSPESGLPGVGLGLAICRAIVEAHGGEIRAEDREGGGARFVFSLPAGEPPPLEPEPPDGETDATGGSPSN
ncbi:MAG: two-component system sensor histidine kinase KdpD [Burkholderiales bacterium]|jgi:two-component system sensor histidine kinase KdpD|nr:two-component system sensor histidine kinase KdpD [Burkholderiales bacterium]